MIILGQQREMIELKGKNRKYRLQTYWKLNHINKGISRSKDGVDDMEIRLSMGTYHNTTI